MKGFCLFVLAGKEEDFFFLFGFGGWARKSCPSSSFVLSVGALLATLTLHRVSCDSVAHDAELGSGRESLDRGQRDGYKGERVRCVFGCVQCCVCPPRPTLT